MDKDIFHHYKVWERNMNFSGFFYCLIDEDLSQMRILFLKRKRLIVEGVMNLILRGRIYINTRGTKINIFLIEILIINSW